MIEVRVTYDKTARRYTAEVVRDGTVVYRSVRAKREVAVWAANNYIAYQS